MLRRLMPGHLQFQARVVSIACHVRWEVTFGMSDMLTVDRQTLHIAVGVI